MAESVVTLTVVNSTTFGNVYRVTGGLTVGASPGTYTAGGILMNLNTQPLIKASRTPFWVDFTGQSGYEYAYVPGTNASNGKLKISTTAGTEVTAGAMPAGVSGDTIMYRVEFKGML